MTYAGDAYVVGTTSVPGNRGITKLTDGTTLTVTYGTSTANRVDNTGTLTDFGSGFSNPHALIQLFGGGELLFGDTSRLHLVSADTGNLISEFGPTDARATFLSQLANSEIWAGEYQGTSLRRFNPDGTELTSLSHPAFADKISVPLQLANGNVLVLCHGPVPGNGRLVFFDLAGQPINLTQAPAGMTLNDDGSITHADIVGPHEALQLPNRQILIASYWAGKIVRLNEDGSYVDTLVLSSCTGNGCDGAPSGLALDHDGSLLVTTGSNQVRRVTFQ